jgi:rhodanese-related sulfurtransferase
MKHTIFLPQYWAEAIKPKDNWYLISIRCPGDDQPTLKRGWCGVLYLEFHDIDKRTDGLTLFTRGQAGEIIKFVEEVNVDATIVIHCSAGISRSAAVAQFLADAYGYTLKTVFLPNKAGTVVRLDQKTDLMNRLVYRTLVEVKNEIQNKLQFT